VGELKKSSLDESGEERKCKLLVTQNEDIGEKVERRAEREVV
jgi:hypothetical protein